LLFEGAGPNYFFESVSERRRRSDRGCRRGWGGWGYLAGKYAHGILPHGDILQSILKHPQKLFWKLDVLLSSRAVTSRNTSLMEVIEYEIAPDIRDEECLRSFSRGVSPLLAAMPPAPILLLAVVELVGFGRM
jgi:hypothetical protein